MRTSLEILQTPERGRRSIQDEVTGDLGAERYAMGTSSREVPNGMVVVECLKMGAHSYTSQL